MIIFLNGISFGWVVYIQKPKKLNKMTFLKQNNQTVFDELMNSFPSTWGKDAPTGYPTASVNIVETEDAYHLSLNAPGREKSDFQLNVENGILTISYEKSNQKEENNFKTIRREFTYRSFKRSFSLDENINAEAIEAKYVNGVLQVLLPKKAKTTTSPKQIVIN
jgi:HSP20 family protein